MRRLVFVMLACLVAVHASPALAGPPKPSGGFAALDRANAAWRKALDQGPLQMAKLYDDRARLYPASGDLLQGREAIARYWQDRRSAIGKITSVRTVARYVVAPSVVYEAAELVTSGATHHLIVVWRKRSGGTGWVRELEAVGDGAIAAPAADLAGVERARGAWIETATRLGAGELVGRHYTENAVYDMDGVLFRGPEIARSRAYATSFFPGSSVALRPRTVVAAGPGIVHEIGEYEINLAEGFYVLIWSLGTDGSWRVRLDYNFD